MEEKILVKSQLNKKMVTILLCCAAALFLVTFLVANKILYDFYIGVGYNRGYPSYMTFWLDFLSKKVDGCDALVAEWFSWFYVPAVIVVIALLFYFYSIKTELVVSDKRVYGKTVFGKRVDLPLDAVSAIGTSFPQKIVLSTASGKISFPMIKNRDDIYGIVSQLLMGRQK